MATSFHRVLSLMVACALSVSVPASAASLKSDASYLKRAAGGTSAVSAKRAARGYIAAQAYAIAGNARFKQAVRKYAKGKSRRQVLAEARRGGQRWLSGISNNALSYSALATMARTSITGNYTAREKKRKAHLSNVQKKGRQLETASKRTERERRRAAGGSPGTLSAASLLAVFLSLSAEDPNGEPAVAQEVASAVGKLESCLQSAASQRQTCLANSNNYYQNAVCETNFAADSLACLSK